MNERLDQACEARIAHEPYFAEQWRAARALLYHAIVGAFVIKFGSGHVCRDGHCGCTPGTRCLHEMSYAIYAGE